MPAPGDPPAVVKLRNTGKEVVSDEKGMQGMEINAVLSVEGKEEVYVSVTWGIERCRADRVGWKVIAATPFLVFYIA
jgi:hypothetical protein